HLRIFCDQLLRGPRAKVQDERFSLQQEVVVASMWRTAPESRSELSTKPLRQLCWEKNPCRRACHPVTLPCFRSAGRVEPLPLHPNALGEQPGTSFTGVRGHR